MERRFGQLSSTTPHRLDVTRSQACDNMVHRSSDNRNEAWAFLAFAALKQQLSLKLCVVQLCQIHLSSLFVSLGSVCSRTSNYSKNALLCCILPDACW
jgi:hypothetical protein